LVWSLDHGKNKFYAWEPIPPSDEFVALGMVGSKTEDPPKVNCVRCVPREWVKNSETCEGIWNDSGAGGRSGSIWTINNMNLIKMKTGHDPPGGGYELKSWRFMLRQFSVGGGGGGAGGAGYAPPMPPR